MAAGRMRVAGLISGTSVDGIDVAVVDIAESIEVVATATVGFPADVRQAILSVSNAATHTAMIARLNFLIGELFAEALESTGVALNTIELIGSHGQTIFHEGEPAEFLGRKIASTLSATWASETSLGLRAVPLAIFSIPPKMRRQT